MGESGARALLGGRVVAVGDVLFEGVVRVEDVRRDSVLLSAAGAQRRVFLPAFEVGRARGPGNGSAADPADAALEDPAAEGLQ